MNKNLTPFIFFSVMNKTETSTSGKKNATYFPIEYTLNLFIIINIIVYPSGLSLTHI